MGFFSEMTTDDFNDEAGKVEEIKPISVKPGVFKEEPVEEANKEPAEPEVVSEEQEPEPQEEATPEPIKESAPEAVSPTEEKPSKEEKVQEALRDGSKKEALVIPKGIVLDGSVEGEVDITVSGEIKGAVKTTKEVKVLGGKVGGEIKGEKSVRIGGGSEINSDISGGTVDIERGCLVKGNIESRGDVSVSGDVIGNISGANISLQASARVRGDITCEKFQVSRGALFAGSISQSGADSCG